MTPPQFYPGTVFLKPDPVSYLKFGHNQYLKKGAEPGLLCGLGPQGSNLKPV